MKQLREVLLRSKQFRRLQPYGVMFGKAYLFELGGRPVIYQPETDYDLLPASFRYRHVRYEPSGASPIDFTWEREWRLRADELHLHPESCSLIVRTDAEREILLRDAIKRHSDKHEAWAVAIGEEMARLHFPEEKFPWVVLAVDSLTATDGNPLVAPTRRRPIACPSRAP